MLFLNLKPVLRDVSSLLTHLSTIFLPRRHAAANQEDSISISRVRSVHALPWTSGKVASNQSSFELPQPAVSTLTAGKTYVFRVRVWTAASASEWSQSVRFDTAPSASAWSTANWIGGGELLGTIHRAPEFQRQSQ